MRFTVLGAQGFLGSHLVAALSARDDSEVQASPRDLWPPAGDLGHVIFAIGVTGDFRARPLDTMTAHVTLVTELLRDARFDSLLYLSSTRVYAGATTGDEEALLRVDPSNPDHLYNASKVAGEAVCLSDPRPSVRVARLSNVYGPPFASGSLVDTLVTATRTGQAVVAQEPGSTRRDYVDVRDVVHLLPRLAEHGRRRLYNVASGHVVTTAQLVATFEVRGLTVRLPGPSASGGDGPPISTRRVAEEFDFRPRLLLDDIDALLDSTEELT